MKKLVAILFAIILFAILMGVAHADPGPLAKFMFEDAEAAFAKQDYQTALAKLDEAEKEFGRINPLILYLRIMTRFELLKQNPQDFDTIERLRGEVARYFKEYSELESVQDKMREVYRISTELKQYPATKAEHDARVQAEAAVRRKEEEARRLAEHRKACPACFPEMIVVPERGYEIGKYEVTQREWQSIMGGNPSNFAQCGGNCPVESVSWNDIQEYLRRLNQKTGKQYRLPTSVEWEHACHGGSNTEYCGSDDADVVAWHNGKFGGGNSGGTTHPVGQKQANGYGLHDMSGNVFEFLQECDGSDCLRRWYRGGAADYGYGWAKCSASHMHANVDVGYRHLGFRLARTLP